MNEIRMMNATLHQKLLNDTKRMGCDIPSHALEDLIQHLLNSLVEEVQQGVDGELSPVEAPFFAAVDAIYEAQKVKDCYFCDRDIDGNAEPFDYPTTTRICLGCMLKVANLLQAFGISPRVLFPGIRISKRQKRLYGPERVLPLSCEHMV